MKITDEERCSWCVVVTEAWGGTPQAYYGPYDSESQAEEVAEAFNTSEASGEFVVDEGNHAEHKVEIDFIAYARPIYKRTPENIIEDFSDDDGGNPRKESG